MWREPLLPFKPEALVRAALVVAGLIGVALLALLLTARVAGIDTTRLRPVSPPAATAPPPSPPALEDVGRSALSRVVTVEADRANEEALGTGWLFDSRGDFVTNAHVVAGQLTVRIADRTAHSHPAVVVGSDPAQDIAIVRATDGFAGTPLPVDTAAVARRVPFPVVDVASGRATGHEDITTGILAEVGQDVPLEPGEVQPGSGAPSLYHDMLGMTGAKVYQGNSGGPLLDSDGRVIGILTLASPSLPRAYAIPIARVDTELLQLAMQTG